MGVFSQIVQLNVCFQTPYLPFRRAVVIHAKEDNYYIYIYKYTYFAMILLQIAFLVVTSAFIALAGSVSKPHVHNGVLEPYDGKPLPLHLTVDQLSQLEKGEAVIFLIISIEAISLQD